MKGIHLRKGREEKDDVLLLDFWHVTFGLHIQYMQSIIPLPFCFPPSLSSSHYFQSFRGWPHYLWCAPINSSPSEEDNQGLLLVVEHICKNYPVPLQNTVKNYLLLKNLLKLNTCRHLDSQIICIHVCLIGASEVTKLQFSPQQAFVLSLNYTKWKWHKIKLKQKTNRGRGESYYLLTWKTFLLMDWAHKAEKLNKCVRVNNRQRGELYLL